MEDSSRGPEEQAYTANLDYTLKELQTKVQQHEKELERVRPPSFYHLLRNMLLIKHAAEISK